MVSSQKSLTIVYWLSSPWRATHAPIVCMLPDAQLCVS
jgi:hypothetical protein